MLGNLKEEDKNFARYIYQIFQKVEKKGGLFVTDFLSLQEQYIFQEISYQFNNLLIRLHGGIPFSERKRGFISDNSENLEYLDIEKYLKGIEIRVKKDEISSSLFRKKLSEKGINEKKIGDIWSIGDKIQMVIEKEIKEEIEKTLTDFNFEYYFISLNNLVPPKGIKILKTTEASLRIDAISSFAFNISRSKMQEIIKNSGIIVNNDNINHPHYEIKEGDLVFVKNLGYFKIITIRETKKGKYFIEIERY
jgi:RNA-binding protein YlmH